MQDEHVSVVVRKYSTLQAWWLAYAAHIRRHLFVHTLPLSLFRNPERDSILSRVFLQCFSSLPMACLQI